MATDNTRNNNSNNRQHEYVQHSLDPHRPSRWRNVLEAGEAAMRARGMQPAVNGTVLDHARLYARRAGK